VWPGDRNASPFFREIREGLDLSLEAIKKVLERKDLPAAKARH
jgi:hypothetical protein